MAPTRPPFYRTAFLLLFVSAVGERHDDADGGSARSPIDGDDGHRPAPETSAAPVFGGDGEAVASPALLQQRQALGRTGAEPVDIPEGGYCELAQRCIRDRVYERDAWGLATCKAGHTRYKEALTRAVAARPSKRSQAVVDKDVLLARLREKFGETDSRAIDMFKELSAFEAGDILAFKETWREEDTQLLLKMDTRNGSWVEGELTTEGIKARLPSISALDDFVARRSLAIVGGGSSLEGQGLASEIDVHPEVVRFNYFPKDATDVGNRTTLHVVNRWVSPAGIPVLLDLEMCNAFDSYCFRFSKYAIYPHAHTPWLIRPTARCAMSQTIDQFTRGFMFFWLVGSLLEEVDMYGFVSGGMKHVQRGQLFASNDIGERFAVFEHKVYREIHDLQSQKRTLSML
eukprot:CAMPEP_0177323350 /NCGR_PEP_ID=MMETSP0368-20130122/16699_1 /TAXON_ID=447022 ORGANISM="Scrippsiella hangoei-like, Strain SHHI-4" /NCGR_SAMPLE_ID=MMETSP0368 /ASSEMBLY_ACC=CAM_ASM_000363 /LENGTH=401 /DNA_ID=CAMNT_0018783117 /DNA_START=15 /DNA_END=1220 /DNA_ORIENTATION=+